MHACNNDAMRNAARILPCVSRLELNGDLLVGLQHSPLVDVSKRTTADLAAKRVFVAYEDRATFSGNGG